MLNIISLSKLMRIQKIKQICLTYYTSGAAKTASSISDESNPRTTETNPSAVKFPTERHDSVPENIPTNIIKEISSDLVKKIKISPVLDKEHLDPIDAVPGPPSLYLLSKIWTHIPFLSEETVRKSVQNIMSFGSMLNWNYRNYPIITHLLNQYGPVVRLQGAYGGDVILLNRPEYIRKIFETDGPFPIRSGFESIENYRLQHRRSKYEGVFLMSGPEWKKLRESFEPPLKSITTEQFNKINQLSDEFINNILTSRNNQEEIKNNFKLEIYKWNLECFSAIIFEEKLGFMSKSGLSTISDPYLLLHGLIDATQALKQCESNHKSLSMLAKKSLIKNCDVIDSILNKYIERARLNLNKKQKNKQNQTNLTFLEKLLLNNNGLLLKDDIVTILLDFLLIAVNVVNHSIIYLLYQLAKCPKNQMELFKEIQRNSHFLTDDQSSVKSMNYLQACIKENLRLNPPIRIMGRLVSNDLNIYNYLIPKGVYIVMAPNVWFRNEEIFDQPEKFLPERWLNSTRLIDYNLIDGNMFSILPFGYGTRGNFLRDFVEIEISLLISKLIKKFRIEHNYGEINNTNQIFSLPNHRLFKFRFIERN